LPQLPAGLETAVSPPCSLDLAATFAALPPEPTLSPRRAPAKLIVLDDDPTGTQTVHGVPVLTRWDQAALATELCDPAPAVFLLTNTRAFPIERAVALNRATGAALRAAADATGRDFIVVSRGDSTLRGHFPAETDALAKALGGVDATFLIPAFFAGGRYTIADVHYVADAGRLIPAGDTEFARDASFGYRSSNLCDWIEEKTAGRISARQVISISLEDLRRNGAAAVADRIVAASSGSFVIVNAAAPGDLSVLTHALADTRLQTRRFLFRTAANFVSAYAGIGSRALLAPAELRAPNPALGGLIVAGSYVGKTTAQLNALFTALPSLVRVELRVAALLDPVSRGYETGRALAAIECALQTGRSAVLHTSRELVTGDDPSASLAIGTVISAALVALVRGLTVRPSWFIAKGGITSSDLATEALGLRRAIVLGQALPGVPVWRAGPESKWPGLAYIVFPGNVGGPDALVQLVAPLL
jgi:uncharacterized protein YgbK (DUF1537 family)